MWEERHDMAKCEHCRKSSRHKEAGNTVSQDGETLLEDLNGLEALKIDHMTSR